MNFGGSFTISYFYIFKYLTVKLEGCGFVGMAFTEQAKGCEFKPLGCAGLNIKRWYFLICSLKTMVGRT